MQGIPFCFSHIKDGMKWVRFSVLVCFANHAEEIEKLPSWCFIHLRNTFFEGIFNVFYLTIKRDFGWMFFLLFWLCLAQMRKILFYFVVLVILLYGGIFIIHIILHLFAWSVFSSSDTYKWQHQYKSPQLSHRVRFYSLYFLMLNE